MQPCSECNQQVYWCSVLSILYSKTHKQWCFRYFCVHLLARLYRWLVTYFTALEGWWAKWSLLTHDWLGLNPRPLHLCEWILVHWACQVTLWSIVKRFKWVVMLSLQQDTVLLQIIAKLSCEPDQHNLMHLRDYHRCCDICPLLLTCSHFFTLAILVEPLFVNVDWQFIDILLAFR